MVSLKKEFFAVMLVFANTHTHTHTRARARFNILVEKMPPFSLEPKKSGF